MNFTILVDPSLLINAIYRYLVCFYRSKPGDRRDGVEVERSPRVREIGARSPVATDLSRKTDSDSSTTNRSATGVSVTGPRR